MPPFVECFDTERTVRSHAIMLDELLTDLETEYQVNGRDTLMDLKGRLRLRLHIHHISEECARRAVTTSDIVKFTSKRQEAGAANGEINRELSAIKASL